MPNKLLGHYWHVITSKQILRRSASQHSPPKLKKKNINKKNKNENILTVDK